MIGTVVERLEGIEGFVAMSFEAEPARWEQIPDISFEVWPEYNLHGDVLNLFWGRLYDVFAAFQFMLYDVGTGEVVAEGHTVPCVWDETWEGLGDGIDAMIIAAFAARARRDRPRVLMRALAAEIRPGFQGRGWRCGCSRTWPRSRVCTGWHA